MLRLEPGVFHFRSLDIGSGGRLEKLGVAPTYVYVEDLLDFKGQTGELPGQLTVMSATTRPIHFHGADPTSAEPDFQGTVFAPFAKVDIHTNYYFAGQVIASDIEVHQDSVVEYRAPELRSICEPY